MTIKSKAFKFLLGIAVVLGVAIFASSASAYDFGTATLRVGSRGADVMEVQRVVGANPVDGIFGPMTMAAVKAWQANNGLEADGVVGNYTKAAMNAVSGVVAPSSGCQAGWIVNPFTNQPCGTTTPTTPSTPSTPSTTLKGEEAQLYISVVEEDDINEEGTDQHAFTIEIEADKNDGDAKIERMDITLNPEKTGSPVTTYRSIEKVALEVDGDVIAELDTDSRSDWRTGNVLRFSNLDLVVKSGDVVEIEVMLDVTDKLDSVELDAVSVRYVDGTGVVETEDETKIGAEVKVKTPDSVDMRITKNSSSPKDSILDVSSSRSNDKLYIADVEVKEGAGTLEDVVVEVEFVGAVDIDDIKSLVSRFALNVDGKQVDTISSSALTLKAGEADIVEMTFDADEFDFEEDDEFEIEVLASFRAYDADGTARAIDTVQVKSVLLKGYDDLTDGTFNESGTFTAPLFTITEGDITVDIDDSTVAVGAPLGNGTTGEISFEVTVKNETGAPLAAMTTGTTWKFDVKGYSDVTTKSVAFEEGDALTDNSGTGGSTADLADGDETTFKVVLQYTQKVTNQSFTIEVKEIDGNSIGYVWKD